MLQSDSISNKKQSYSSLCLHRYTGIYILWLDKFYNIHDQHISPTNRSPLYIYPHFETRIIPDLRLELSTSKSYSDWKVDIILLLYLSSNSPPATSWLWLLPSSGYYVAPGYTVMLPATTWLWFTLHSTRSEVITTFQPKFDSNVSQSNLLSSNIGLQMFQIDTPMVVSTAVLLPLLRRLELVCWWYISQSYTQGKFIQKTN